MAKLFSLSLKRKPDDSDIQVATSVNNVALNGIVVFVLGCRCW